MDELEIEEDFDDDREMELLAEEEQELIERKAREEQMKKERESQEEKKSQEKADEVRKRRAEAASKKRISEVISVANDKSYLAARGTSSEASDVEKSAAISENPFIATDIWTESTIYPSTSISSFTYLKEVLSEGIDPVAAKIQIHELLNAFPYSFAESEFSISLVSEVHPCPWKTDNYLLMVGVQINNALEEQFVNPVIEMSFDPESVKEFRLLGYENLAKEATESSDRYLNPGYSSAFLVEIKLHPEFTGEKLGVMKFLSVQNDVDIMQNISLSKNEPISDDFLLASCIGEMGLFFRDSKYMGTSNIENVLVRMQKLKDAYDDLDEIYTLLELRYSK